MNDLSLTLLTPTQKLAFNLPIESLHVVAAKGELEILKDHAPLVTTLGIGLLRYREKSQHKSQKIAIFWGYLEVFNNSVNVLAEMAERPDQIDPQKAKKSLKEAIEGIKKGEEKDYIKAEKARLRLALVEKNDSQ